IGTSRFAETGLSNLFPEVVRGVIYPPVALTRPADASRWRSAIRAQQQVSEDTVVIIQVSRLEPWKGHLSHLEALAQLKPTLTPWQCWIVGGPQRPEEQEYLRQLQDAATELGIAGRLRFLGQRSDVPQLLAAADIFCQPNQTPEPFGISFVEALWAG